MGKLKTNPVIGELRGIIGDLVFAKHKKGEVVVRKLPERTAETTEGEAANRGRFGGAIAYARGVWAGQPELRARYLAAARLLNRAGFQFAVADFIRSPRVEEIDLSGYTGNPGEVIRVKAVNIFEVKSVQVVIKELGGALIEQGAAVLENDRWTYAPECQVPAGQTVVIEVSATDHPGHTATKRVDHACGPRSPV